MNFLAPAPFASVQTRNNGVYTADANSLISGVVASAAIVDLIEANCVPLAWNPIANFRNVLDGGDFTVNPFQRNCAGLATSNQNTTAIANTVTYFADRWFSVGGASSAILQGAIANTTVPGFGTCLQFQRKSANANTAVISLGQVVESLDVIKLQGQTVTFSFWAAAGALYSGGALTVQMYVGTGVNDTAANMVAGSWAGSATPINTTQVLTTGMVRYQFTGVVPVTATALGVLLSYTPTGTAGATDYISFMGFQLEVGANASPFEHRDAQVELEICQRYAYLIAEPASGVVVGVGQVGTLNEQTFALPTPVQMFKAPTVTVATGGFQIGVAAALGASTISAGSTHTPNMLSVTGAKTATAGVSALLAGGAVASGGYILASTDF